MGPFYDQLSKLRSDDGKKEKRKWDRGLSTVKRAFKTRFCPFFIFPDSRKEKVLLEKN